MITVNNKSPGAYNFATPLGLKVLAKFCKFCIINKTLYFPRNLVVYFYTKHHFLVDDNQFA